MSARQAVREDPLVRLLPVLRPVAGRLALGAAAGAGALACGVGLMATAAWLISRAAEHPPVMYLMVGTVAVRAFGLFRGVLRYAERLVSHDAALRALGSLRGLVLERLEPLAPGGLTAFRRGDLLARFTADVDGLQEQLLRGLTPAASALAAGLASVLVVGILLPSAGAVLVVGLLCAGIGGPVLSSRLGSRGGRRAVERRRELDTAVVDLLDGAAELLANGAMDAALEHVRNLDVAVRHEGTRARTSPALPDALPLLVAGLTVWVALLLGGAAVRSGALSPTLLAVVVLTSLAAFDAVSGLPAAGSSLGRSRELARRLLEVLDAPVPAAEPATGAVVVVPEGPLGLLVEAAHLRYSPGGPDVLGGVSLSVAAGTRTALVGPSGAAKSSLVAALLRFHDLDGGRVALTSGHGRVATDLATLPGDTVRSLIRGVTADAHVFDATLRENVLLGRPGASQQELDAVAARVRLLDWIRTLPQGWETQVGVDGVSVSGGERQRLLLARALLADPRVLVLDEPTAHLDLETEAAVMTDLMRATEGRTVLLVTHREAGLAACDSVVRLGDDVRAGEPALTSV